jgi:spermidine/putrescine transport system ATP-binding protein
MTGGDITLVDLTKRFGPVVAVDALNLQIQSGEFFSLLGSSGCGKTTTLRMIAGFEKPSQGQILLDGEDVAAIPAYKRNVNTVFQSYALFPHLRVFDNVAFGLRRAGVEKQEMRRRVAEALAQVELTGLERRKPSQLSGGQQQRVALARVLVLQPAVVLLDEPLGALDAKIRRSLQVELKALQERVGLTFVYVTHDQEEALTMSDRLAVMNQGRVEQLGAPKTVYENPETTFVADFLGISNMLTGNALGAVDGRSRVQVGEFELSAAAGAVEARGQTKLVIRPERVQVQPHDSVGANRLPGMVERVVYRGNSSSVFIRLPNGDLVQALVQNGGDERQYAGGDPVRLHLAPEALRVLTDTGTAAPRAVADDDGEREAETAVGASQTKEERDR